MDASDNPIKSVEAEKADDVILVNPGGKLVEVTAEQAEELLAVGSSEGQFRLASEADVKRYREHAKLSMPAVLKQRELRRLKQEARDALDVEAAVRNEIENSDLGEPTTNSQIVEIEDRARAEDSQPVTTSEPATAEPTTGDGEQVVDQNADNNAPKPRGRGKAKK